MKFTRYYSVPDRPVEDQITWKTIRCEIPGANFLMEAVEVPKDWSQDAANILAQKYLRKAGVPLGSLDGIAYPGIPSWLWPRNPDPAIPTGSETSARQVFHRLAGCWTYWGCRGGYLNAEEDARVFYDEMFLMLARQVGAPNSPQWFNTGLHWAYGIEGDAAGLWAVGLDGKPFETANAYEHPQVHACFINSVDDNLVGKNGIFDLLTREARIFKFGSGAGSNFSKLRGKGEPLSGGGSASGVMSFLSVLDSGAGSIASGGVTRRAAKMVVLDADHPEIEEFIERKAREEYKAAALAVGTRYVREAVAAGKPGYVPPQLLARAESGEELPLIDLGWESEALATVDGQNANWTVRVTDAFMRAVADNQPWPLTARTTGRPVKTVPAGDLWNKIARAAWASADPGLQFDTTINAWHTCPGDGRINASNPCSEYVFLDDTACNLASLRLTAFLTEDFNLTAYEHAVRLWTVVLEISVFMAAFPSEEIARRSYLYRTLGLGYADLGGLLMRQAIPYDSARGRALAAGLTALLTGIAYRTSAELAKAVGPFSRWEANADSMRGVMEKHAYEVTRVRAYLDDGMIFNSWEKIGLLAEAVWTEVLKAEAFRNAQVTVLAPTGTISFVMDCDTTGVEPDFALVKHKSLAGGGSMSLINNAAVEALRRLNYSEIMITKAQRELKETGSLRGTIDDSDLPVFDCANDLDPMGHVKMVAAVQPFLSGAVSKTINLPRSATVDDVKQIYEESWKLGLKAVALYRDGSKLNQPLSAVGAALPTDVKAERSRALPSRRRGYNQAAIVGGHRVYLHTGEYEDGKLGEIFLTVARDGEDLRAWASCTAIAISIGLQHGVPLEAYVKTLLGTKFSPAGPVRDHEQIKMSSSIMDFVMRDLAINYLGRNELAHVIRQVTELRTGTDDLSVTTIVGDSCPECHDFSLVKTGSCVTCNSCGYNSGCG